VPYESYISSTRITNTTFVLHFSFVDTVRDPFRSAFFRHNQNGNQLALYSCSIGHWAVLFIGRSRHMRRAILLIGRGRSCSLGSTCTRAIQLDKAKAKSKRLHIVRTRAILFIKAHAIGHPSVHPASARKDDFLDICINVPWASQISL